MDPDRSYRTKLMRRHAAIAILSLVLTGCASAQPGCKRIGDAWINGARLITSICDRKALPRVCQKPGQNLNGCAYRREDEFGNTDTCWRFLANDRKGAEADPHEVAHCGGADEHEARCADWPGTKAPKGQECRH